MRFSKYNEPSRLPANEKYLCFKWQEPKTYILFSVCQQGKGLRVHMLSDKKSLRKLKQAVKEFHEFCFKTFESSKVLFAIVDDKKPGIIRFCKKCGYKKLMNYKGHTTLIMEEP